MDLKQAREVTDLKDLVVDLERKLGSALAEVRRLESEVRRLKEALRVNEKPLSSPPPS